MTYLDILVRPIGIGIGRRELPLDGSHSPGTSDDYGLHPFDEVGNGQGREGDMTCEVRSLKAWSDKTLLITLLGVVERGEVHGASRDL